MKKNLSSHSWFFPNFVGLNELKSERISRKILFLFYRSGEVWKKYETYNFFKDGRTELLRELEKE